MWDLIKITISLKDPRVTYQSRQTLRPTPNSVRWDEVNQVKYRFQALHFQGDGKFTSGLTKAAAHRCSSKLTTVKKFGYFKSKHPCWRLFCFDEKLCQWCLPLNFANNFGTSVFQSFLSEQFFYHNRCGLYIFIFQWRGRMKKFFSIWSYTAVSLC